MDHLTKSQALKYLRKGHFPPGSMGPKVKSAIDFLEYGGKKVVVTSLESAYDALKGNTGTTIVND